MQDAQWAKVVSAVKPGMRDSEITALAQYQGELLDSEQGLFRCSSALVAFSYQPWQSRF